MPDPREGERLRHTNVGPRRARSWPRTHSSACAGAHGALGCRPSSPPGVRAGTSNVRRHRRSHPRWPRPRPAARALQRPDRRPARRRLPVAGTSGARLQVQGALGRPAEGRADSRHRVPVPQLGHACHRGSRRAPRLHARRLPPGRRRDGRRTHPLRPPRRRGRSVPGRRGLRPRPARTVGVADRPPPTEGLPPRRSGREPRQGAAARHRTQLGGSGCSVRR